MILRRLAPGLPLLPLLLLLACGLPSDTVERAAELNARIDAEAARLAEAEAGIDRLLASEEFAFAAPYAKREDWWARPRAALERVAEIRRDFDTEVKPLLEADRREDQRAVEKELARLRAALARLRGVGREAIARAEALRAARDDGPELVAGARAELERLREEARALTQHLEKTEREFPARSEDMQTGRSVVAERLRAAGEGLDRAERELQRSGDADLAALADGLAAVAREAGLLRQYDEMTREATAQLYRSYSKTLVDMKEEFWAEIGRTSWNDYYDFPAEHEYRYPRRAVDAETLEALERHGDQPLALGRHLRIDPAVWSALSIDPNEQLPRGDNAAEFWVADSGARYFHKYMLVEGSERTETDWEPVSEELFEQHIDDLGMDIVSKPYGVYEEEALQQAMPPGYAYVGDSRYGRWEEDQSGRRRWSWADGFLWYYLLFGGNRHYYYHDDWRRWDSDYRGRRAWYGGVGGAGRYGTFGSATRNGSRFAGSRWARSGGFDRQDRSIRGAAAAGRGGGPGGRGK